MLRVWGVFDGYASRIKILGIDAYVLVRQSHHRLSQSIDDNNSLSLALTSC